MSAPAAGPRAGVRRSGYAGAREMAREIEYLYGFRATSAEQMSGTFWRTYDVFVTDKHGLNLDEFFNRENPFAQQSIAARLLEVDRQGSYRFSDDQRANLVRIYVESVAQHGISCSANTCGNLQVNQYVAEQAPLVEGLGNERLERFGLRVARATGWTARCSAASAPHRGPNSTRRFHARAKRRPRSHRTSQASRSRKRSPAWQRPRHHSSPGRT